MIDTGKRNILEENTVQDVINGINGIARKTNDTNAKTNYILLQDTEKRIVETIKRIDEISSEELFDDEILMTVSNVVIDGKTLTPEEKESYIKSHIANRKKSCFNAKRNWQEALNYLQNDILPIVEEIIQPTDTNQAPKAETPKPQSPLQQVINCYSKFSEHYEILKEHNFFRVSESNSNCLQWLKSKQSLAEYFNYIKPESLKRHNWKCIENLFSQKRLASNLSRNGNSFKTETKDFEEIKTILENS